MAQAGRKPKPIEQKMRDGTLRPRDIARTPLVVGGRTNPKPSTYLTKLQKKQFRRLVAELKTSGILDAADRGMVELAAIEEANIIECNAAVECDGAFIEHKSDRGAISIREHPAIASRRQSLNGLRQLYGELGIGPASRARLKTSGVESKAPRQNIPGIARAIELKVVGNG